MPSSMKCPVCGRVVGRQETACQGCDTDLSLQIELHEQADVQYNSSISLARDGKLADAERAAAACVAIRPDHVEGLTLRAKILGQLGRYEDARLAFQEALRVDPNHGPAAAGMDALRRIDVQRAAVASRRRMLAVGGVLCGAATLGAVFLLGSSLSQPARVQIVEVPVTVQAPQIAAARTETPLPAPQPTLVVQQATPQIITVTISPPTIFYTAQVTALLAAFRDDPSIEGIPLAARQEGDRIVISGAVPSLEDRYRVENVARAAAGAAPIDLTGVSVRRTYTVAPGDTLWAISNRFYGSPKYVSLLARTNKLTNAAFLRSGQEIILPLP